MLYEIPPDIFQTISLENLPLISPENRPMIRLENPAEVFRKFLQSGF